MSSCRLGVSVAVLLRPSLAMAFKTSVHLRVDCLVFWLHAYPVVRLLSDVVESAIEAYVIPVFLDASVLE